MLYIIWSRLCWCISPQKLLFCYHLPTRGRVGVKLGDAWYVSNVSIIFDASCLFMHHFLCVLFTLHGVFMHFPELPINEMPQFQFPVFCCFCVSEKLHRKYSRNWTKQNLKSLITWHEDRVQRRAGDGPGASHTLWWRRLGLARAPGGVTAWSIPWHHPFAYLFPPSQNPKGPNSFPENIMQATIVIDVRSGGSRSSSRHPAGEGNHHQRPSSSPCLPPEWCVSSLPWTMGP
jgi:hypothetical protein